MLSTLFKVVLTSNAVLVALIAVGCSVSPSLMLVPAFDSVDRFLNWCDNSTAVMAANKYYAGIWSALKTEGSHSRSVTGRIPQDLDGIFLRNGPNPQHPPISKYHMFDGDGMVHAVRLQAGNATVRHTNKWIRTPVFEEEKAAGRARYLKVSSPRGMDQMAHLGLRRRWVI